MLILTLSTTSYYKQTVHFSIQKDTAMGKIAIFTGSGAAAIHAANVYHEALNGQYHLFFIEEKSFTPRKIKKFLVLRLKNKGILSCFGSILLYLYKMLLEKEQQPQKRYKICLHTSDLNSDERVKEFLKNEQLNLAITNGCSILSKCTLSNLACPTLNLHVGITPRYRGTGNIWAFYENEPENAGFTVHKVVESVDSGERLVCRHINFKNKNIEFKNIDSEAARIGANALVEFIKTRKIDINKNYIGLSDARYFIPTLWEYLRAKRNYEKISRMS